MKYVFLLIGTIAFVGCTEVVYKEPQPRGIKSLEKVPAKLHGVYYWKEDGDTIEITAQGFRAFTKKEDVLFLSDSLVMKKYKGYYYVSYRDDYRWLLRVLQPGKNGDLSYLEMDNVPDQETERKVFLKNLSAQTPVLLDTINEKIQYRIDPAPQKLNSLVKQGFFKEKGLLIKIR